MFQTIKKSFIYTFSNVGCLIALAVFFFVFEFDIITSLVLTLVMGAILFHYRSKTTTKKNKQPLAKVSSQKEEFYHSKGLTKDEIQLFRKTMQTAREHIYAIEKSTNKSNKLKAIAIRHNTIAIIKDFFKHIVEQPNRLHEVNHFLYTYLPNLKEITESYVEIDSHLAKTKETYQSLETGSKTMEDLCQLITKDYLSFMSNGIDDIDIEVELANHVLNRDNKENEPLSDDY